MSVSGKIVLLNALYKQERLRIFYEGLSQKAGWGRAGRRHGVRYVRTCICCGGRDISTRRFPDDDSDREKKDWKNQTDDEEL